MMFEKGHRSVAHARFQQPEVEGILQEAERVFNDGLEDFFNTVLHKRDIPLLLSVLAVLRRRKVFYAGRLIVRIINSVFENADLNALSPETQLMLCDSLFELARKPKFVGMVAVEQLVSLAVRCENSSLVASAMYFVQQQSLDPRFLETCRREALSNSVVAFELVKVSLHVKGKVISGD
jgi:hypothetical protein